MAPADRPKTQQISRILDGDGQGITLDIQGLGLLNEATSKEADDSKVLPALLVTHVLALASLREKHAGERLIPCRFAEHFILGIVSKGKGKPGFHVAIPRLDVGSRDVGLMLWQRYLLASKTNGKASEGIAVTASGGHLSLQDINNDLKDVMREYGMTIAEQMSSRCLRPVHSTAAGCWRPEDIFRPCLGD